MPPGPPSAISRSRERCSLLAESSPFAALQEPPGPLQPPGSLPLARADADADCRALESTKNRSSAPGHCRNAYRSVQTAATSSHAATCARSAFAEQPSRARAMNAPPPACAWVLPSGAGPSKYRPLQNTARQARRPPRPACNACTFARPPRTHARARLPRPVASEYRMIRGRGAAGPNGMTFLGAHGRKRAHHWSAAFARASKRQPFWCACRYRGAR